MFNKKITIGQLVENNHRIFVKQNQLSSLKTFLVLNSIIPTQCGLKTIGKNKYIKKNALQGNKW